MERWGEHFTCIAPDTPGFGQSDPLPDNPEINEFADALAEFVAVLGVESCAAYGFHSGGIICVTALRRHPELFTCLAIGGYAIWSDEEMRVFGESYLPEFHPTDYGEHLTWLWNRMLEQSWFFPWFDVREKARLSVAHADISRVNQAVMEMLDAGNDYRAGYGAVLRAPRDIPAPDAITPPVLITAYDGDPLQAHLKRLGEMPARWDARAVSTPAVHQEESLTFLREHAGDAPCPTLAEDSDEGWLKIGSGLVHWRGAKGTAILGLHAPAGEAHLPDSGELVIDAPGHGHSDPQADMKAAIEEAAGQLGASQIAWPSTPAGEPELLYPDLTADRFGSHLLRAWSAARAECFFEPWYEAQAGNAVAFTNEAIQPAAIAKKAYARLRAGAAAKIFHILLQSIQGGPR